MLQGVHVSYLQRLLAQMIARSSSFLDGPNVCVPRQAKQPALLVQQVVNLVYAHAHPAEKRH
jgi:hypothetical protein